MQVYYITIKESDAQDSRVYITNTHYLTRTIDRLLCQRPIRIAMADGAFEHESSFTTEPQYYRNCMALILHVQDAL